MNKKAFTLVELLAVITLIGLMGILVIPAVNKEIKSFKQAAYKDSIKSITEAARNWGSDNPLLLPVKDGEIVTITLSTLKSSGYISNSIKNPITDREFPNDMLIEVTKKGKRSIIYTVAENTGTTDVTEINERSPRLILKGSSTEYVNYKSSYVDPGYNSYSYAGTDLSNIVTKTITKNGSSVSSVNTSQKGTYLIKYVVKYNNMTTTMTRTVIVSDLEGPVIAFDGCDKDGAGRCKNTTRYIDRGTIYTVPSASATDNSGENIVVSHNPNVQTIEANKKGTYKVVYSASDSSGNKSNIILMLVVEE